MPTFQKKKQRVLRRAILKPSANMKVRLQIGMKDVCSEEAIVMTTQPIRSLMNEFMSPAGSEPSTGGTKRSL